MSIGFPPRQVSECEHEPDASLHFGEVLWSECTVNGPHSTEPILLRLKLSAWTIRTVRRKPGSLPNGTPRSAHQISPRVMASQIP